jgi:hypothetical protein
LDEVLESRFKVMSEIEKEKLQVAKAYNKRVKENAFRIGDLVWKTILPLGAQDHKFSKWSPGWEGPYRVAAIVLGNTYFVEALDGKGLARALNRKYLEKYHPSVWQGA